jgi:sugar lactone lactonase YvrE
MLKKHKKACIMKLRFLKIIVGIMLGLLINSPLYAKISPLVNFQGYITDKSGMPVADGDYDVKFSIFDGDDETASELWNEIQQVSVKNGFYTASLGAVTAFKDPNRDTDESDALGFSQPYFLGIKVRQSGETSWDEIGFEGRYLPLSSVWSAFRSKTSAGRLIAIKDENTVISDAEDMLLVVGNTQITLSQALNAAGRMITIKKIDPKGTVVSLITKNGETIDGVNHDPNDGADPFELTEKFQEINLISDGRNWISTGGQLSFDAGSGNSIAPDSIQTSHLTNQAVTAEKLADNSVTSQKLAFEDLTIPHKNLELTHSISNDDIAPDAAIAYTKLQLDGAIDTNDLANQSVTAEKLDLASLDLSYSMINLTGLIIDSDIAENAAISHTKLDLTGLSSEILLGTETIAYKNLKLTESITNADISQNAEISYDKIDLNNRIQTNDITNSSVTYPKLNLDNGDIPYAKLSLIQSITNTDIADNAQISYTKLALHDQISTGDLENGAVTASKMFRDAVDSINIVDGSITSEDLAMGCVTPDKLYVSQSGTSGQVLTADGVGGFSWQTISDSGSLPDELPKLTVLGHSQLNTVTAQSAIITQASITTHLTSKTTSVLTATVHQADIQLLRLGQTELINMATTPQSLTVPDVSGQFLISGHPMITAREISEKAIESQHIENGAIQDAHIASNAKIPYGKLFLDSAIQGKDVASKAISYEKLNLANKIVPYTVLDLTGAIQASDLATGSLGYSAIDLTNSIQSKDIVDSTIQSHDIADQTIVPQNLSGILNNGMLKEVLTSDGGGSFYWAAPSPFDAKISEINYKEMLGAGEINVPTGIVVTENNYVLLAERSADRIRLFNNEGQMNTASIGSGKLNSPQGMVLDKNNNLYVVDRLNDRVQKFSINVDTETGEWIQTIGEGYLNEPYGIALDKQGKIYVTDTETHQVQVFTSDGSFDYTFGGLGASAGNFNTPYDIAIDRSGNIFVLDSGNFRVQKFDANWQFRTEFPPAQNRDLGTAYGINVDDSGNVYVADTTNSRIQIYDNNGYFIRTIVSTESLFNPKQLVLDRSGMLYVSDTNNNRIQIFKPEDPIYTIRSTTVGIGTVNPYTASALQIDSNTGGVLIPRMKDLSKIENPVEGLLVYQTDGHSGFYFFNGTQWINFDSNLYDNTVTEQIIANDAVTTAKVLDNSLTGDDIQNQSLPVTKLSISGTPQDGHMLVADGTSLKWQAYNQLSHILTVGDGGQYDTINHALASITDNSDTNRYLIKVGPGIFVEQIILKPYVDIEGSGENQTIVLYTGSTIPPSTDSSSATVIGAMNCEVRFLSIVSQPSGGNYALGLYNMDASTILNHITINATGTLENTGIYNIVTTVNLTVKDCKISATGGTQNFGIQTAGNMLIHDTLISAAIGILQDNGTVEVDQGRITSSFQSVQANEGTIRLLGTRLEGLVSVGNQGDAQCIGVYGGINNNLSFYTDSCPQ